MRRKLVRDQTTEDFLNENGFKWEYVEEYQLAGIDMKGVEHNQGRMGERLDIAYAKSLGGVIKRKNGRISAIVVLANGDKKSTIATGAHRIKGALDYCDPPRTTLPTYVVYEPVPARRQLLIRSLNTLWAKAPTPMSAWPTSWRSCAPIQAGATKVW